MNCPKCCTNMETVSTDDRQEWCRIIYYCEKCDRDYSRLITRKLQSSMIESDEWEDYENEENCPLLTYECVYYDGENGGVYRLLDFDPNGLDKKALLKRIESHLLAQCFIDPDGIELAMKSVYLLNVNTLIRVKDESDENS